jgi:hypothetical protein
MKTTLFHYSRPNWVEISSSGKPDSQKAQLILCFGGKSELMDSLIYPSLKTKFPQAEIVLCSTAGQISGGLVNDQGATAVCLEFEQTLVRPASVNINNYKDSYQAGLALGSSLPPEDLIYMMILSDGSLVNGSELVKGLNESTGSKIPVTGGLAGDGTEFKSTLVGLNGQASEGMIVAIGFYGSQLQIHHGSQGGWETFGLEKKITRSIGNILYEIEGQNALDLYKKYLGPEAAELPKSALFFPLSITIPGSNQAVVRTILSIDEQNKSMIFAGDVPEGSSVRFMKANFNRLTDAAASAARQTTINKQGPPVFALLISCVGRKIVLGPRVEEEVDAVAEAYGKNTILAGFYSYGEISPFNEGGDCQLHNQTMTITSFYELP